MFGWDGISDHASWNEVFYYWDTKLACGNIQRQLKLCMHTAEDNQLTIDVHEHFSQLVTLYWNANILHPMI